MDLRPTAYRFDGFTVDLRAFRVSRGEEAVRLEPKAFEVLVHLIERRDRVVEKAELLDAVWRDAFVTENALTRVIAQLRKGLGDSREGRYIETAHKRGYRFVAPVEVEASAPAALAPGGAGAPVAAPGPVPAADPAPPETPHAGVSPRPASGHSSRRALFAAALALLLLAAGGLAMRGAGGPTEQIDAIAVLPIANESGQPDADYLSDGVTEGLINELSRHFDARIIARSTAFQYRDRGTDPVTTGRQLDVDVVTTGRLVRRGDVLVLSIDAVGVGDGRQLWGKRYDRTAADLPRLQQELAADLGAALGLRPRGVARRAGAERPASVPAYEAYLRGRYHWNTQTIDGLGRSITFFERAIEEDPTYAAAYAGLADAYTVLGGLGFVRPAEAFPKARSAASRAAELDPGSAEAFAALAATRLNMDWDWAAAGGELDRAIELDPGCARAHLVRSEYLILVGRAEEAIREARLAKDLDPLGLAVTMRLGWACYGAGRYDDAISEFEAALDLNPNYGPALYGLGESQEAKGMRAESVATLERAKAASGGDPSSSLIYAYARAGRRADALRELERLEEFATHQYVSPYHFALASLGLGDRSAAIDWLERAYAERSGTLASVSVNPRFRELRGDARFDALMQRVGSGT